MAEDTQPNITNGIGSEINQSSSFDDNFSNAAAWDSEVGYSEVGHPEVKPHEEDEDIFREFFL